MLVRTARLGVRSILLCIFSFSRPFVMPVSWFEPASFQLAQIEKSEISPDAILDSLAGLPSLLGPNFPARPERSPNQKPSQGKGLGKSDQ
jgi:hypothetical protein